MARLAPGTPISPAALVALRDAIIERSQVRLPGQLARADYEQTDAVLSRLGGKWNRSARAHVWPDSDLDTDALAAVIAAGVLPPDQKQQDGWFPTPPALAEQAAQEVLACLEMPFQHVRVLEPSAGEGALADALVSHGVTPANITCVEPDPYRAAILRRKGYHVAQARFQTWAAFIDPEGFDRVVLNPPFTEPDDKLAWATHLELAWQQVANGGRLVAIVPNSLAFRRTRQLDALRDLVAQRGAWEKLPAGSFLPSGTGVQVLLVTMNRPLTAPLDPSLVAFAAAREQLGGRARAKAEARERARWQLSLFGDQP